MKVIVSEKHVKAFKILQTKETIANVINANSHPHSPPATKKDE